MDISAKDQTIVLSPADISPMKAGKELEEPDDGSQIDLGSGITAKKRFEPVLEYGCSPGGEYVQLIIEGHSSIAIKKQTLRDASPYFASLLKYNEERIEMTPPANVHSQRYVAVLHSVSNSQPPAVDECNMWDFFVLARYFLMKELEDTCCRVIRRALATMTMDECCRLWRKARAEECEDLTKWFLAGMVRNLGQAGETLEFLKFDIEELMAVLSDDEFLPVFEEDVYKAITDWCGYIPEQRMTRDILDVLLDEIVWDHYDTAAFRQMALSAPPPLQSTLEAIAPNAPDRQKPKRAVARHLIFGHEAYVQPEAVKLPTRVLLHYDSIRGTLRIWNAPAACKLCTKVSWRYVAHDLKVGHPTVVVQMESDATVPTDLMAVVNLVDGKVRTVGDGFPGGDFSKLLTAGYNMSPTWCQQSRNIRRFGPRTEFFEFGFQNRRWEPKPAPFQCKELQKVASCSLQLPEGERTAHLVSYVRLNVFAGKRIPENVIGFHNKHMDFLSALVLLPALPAPRRHGAAIVQCGTFLFVTGGSDMTKVTKGHDWELVKPCYRLDLTARDRWERIGDLSVSRMDHCMFVKCGRVFVYGGSTLNADKKKLALKSFETYDPYADSWTVFNIPVTGGGDGDMGSGCIGDMEQTTYCLDLGDSVDETKYRELDDSV